MTEKLFRRLIPLALVLASLLVVTGCGDDSESEADDARIKAVITGFFADVGEANGTEACDALTTGNVRLFSAVAPVAGVPATCPDAIRAVHGHLSEEEKDALQTTKVREVTITGDTATVDPEDVEFELEGRSTLLSSVKSRPVELKKVDDEWKIESLG